MIAMRSPVRFYSDRDVEKWHGLRLVLQNPFSSATRGVCFGVQWRSWEHPDPWMLAVSCFVFGTFLWAHPNGWGYWDRKCCSNGITLFHWTIFNPKE
jgi:hypothetical protein